MIFASVFNQRVRGFRLIDVLALAVVGVLAIGSYVFTTFATAQSARIAAVDTQIAQEEKRVRLLRAEIAHLEDPSRIERLSTQYLGLQARDPSHEITPADLARVVAAAETAIPAAGLAPSNTVTRQ
jgi:cell division protein FtsL